MLVSPQVHQAAPAPGENRPEYVCRHRLDFSCCSVNHQFPCLSAAEPPVTVVEVKSDRDDKTENKPPRSASCFTTLSFL